MDQQVEELLAWAQENHMVLSYKKSYLMTFFPDLIGGRACPVKIAGIKEVNKFKYLGIVLCQGFLFREHLSKVRQDFARVTPIVHQIIATNRRITPQITHVYAFAIAKWCTFSFP